MAGGIGAGATTRQRARRLGRGARLGTAVVMMGALGLGLIGATSCSSGTDDASPLIEQVAPTKADLARDARITFPASTADFRLVRISGSQLDVTFTIASADVDAFASGSGITLTEGRRVITHASPLWDVAVTGSMSGGSSTKGNLDRSAEVVPDGDRATVRLTVTKR